MYIYGYIYIYICISVVSNIVLNQLKSKLFEVDPGFTPMQNRTMTWNMSCSILGEADTRCLRRNCWCKGKVLWQSKLPESVGLYMICIYIYINYLYNYSSGLHI